MSTLYTKLLKLVVFLPPGSVVLNNWKPLPFERISDGSRATVGDVLGELTTVATLRIQLLRPRPTPLQDIKDKLLILLLVQSRPLLISTGCPLDEVSSVDSCFLLTHFSYKYASSKMYTYILIQYLLYGRHVEWARKVFVFARCTRFLGFTLRAIKDPVTNICINSYLQTSVVKRIKQNRYCTRRKTCQIKSHQRFRIKIIQFLFNDKASSLH